MKTGQNGINLIKHYEGCELKAYQKIINGVKDSCTVGFGHCGYVNHELIKVGQIITQAKANELLVADLYSFEQAVFKALKVIVTQNQFDAMVSLAFNIGIGAFLKSSVLKFTNEKNINEASKAFLMWTKVNGKVCLGLAKRRASESVLYAQNKLVLK